MRARQKKAVTDVDHELLAEWDQGELEVFKNALFQGFTNAPDEAGEEELRGGVGRSELTDAPRECSRIGASRPSRHALLDVKLEEEETWRASHAALCDKLAGSHIDVDEDTDTPRLHKKSKVMTPSDADLCRKHADLAIALGGAPIDVEADTRAEDIVEDHVLVDMLEDVFEEADLFGVDCGLD